MSKPIFIIKLPKETVDLHKEKYLQMYCELQSKLNDYHVLIFSDTSSEIVEFECFNLINQTEKDIEELKQMCLNLLNEQSNM
jgi:hypothetical protein